MEQSLSDQIRYGIIQNLLAAQNEIIKSGDIQKIIVLSDYIFELSKRYENATTESSDIKEVADSIVRKTEAITEEIDKYKEMINPFWIKRAYNIKDWKRAYEKLKNLNTGQYDDGGNRSVNWWLCGGLVLLGFVSLAVILKFI